MNRQKIILLLLSVGFLLLVGCIALALFIKSYITITDTGIFVGVSAPSYTIADYDKAIEQNPDDALAYDDRGWFYETSGNYKQAIADYTKAIELDPEDELAYNNRGRCYEETGAYEQALADYNKVIELNPDDGYAYYVRGYVFYELGDLDKAIWDFEKYLELIPYAPEREEMISLVEQLKSELAQ